MHVCPSFLAGRCPHIIKAGSSNPTVASYNGLCLEELPEFSTSSGQYYIQGNHQQYMAARFSLSVASPINRCACPSQDSGSDGWLSTPTNVPLSRPSMVAKASRAASLAWGVGGGGDLPHRTGMRRGMQCGGGA